MEMGLAASVPLLAATLTNIMGGTLSDRLVHAWGNLRRGRVMVLSGDSAWRASG